MITAYGRGSDPIVLWGSWLGSEVIIGVDPLVERGGLDAADCWGPLRTWPLLTEEMPDGIGGGWFAVLGYDPGTSWLAFCDAVLRRRADGQLGVRESRTGGPGGRDGGHSGPSPGRAVGGGSVRTVRPRHAGEAQVTRHRAALPRRRASGCRRMITWPGSSG